MQTDFVKLESLCTTITDGSHFSPKSIDVGYPMLSVKDMRANGFDYSDCNHISKEDYEILKRNGCVPIKNDVLIAKDGSYLKEIFVVKENKEQAILSSIGILRPNMKKVDPYFLKYYLSTDFIRRQVGRKYVSGSALPRIILKGFKDIDVPNIELYYQKEIAGVLKCLDDKIDVNEKIISTISKLIRTIYEQWFLQFHINNYSFELINSSELGRMIPSGWRIERIENIVDLALGGTPSTKNENFWNGNINWLNSGEVSNFPVTESELLITKAGMENSATKLLPKNTTVVSITGNIRCSITAIDTCANQSVVGIIENKKWHTSYIFQVITDLLNKYEKISTGNCQQHINKKTIEDSFVLIPPDNIMQQYYELVDDMYLKILSTGLENRELSRIKNNILPLLMNGQILVK